MKAEWQPIGTAPRDGRVILGFWSQEYVETIAFRGGEWVWSNDGDTWLRGGPTHWMPLPEPPGPTMQNELTNLIEQSIARVSAMTPEERAVMHQMQAESYARSLDPCKHGKVDWEDCVACRHEALGCENDHAE